MPIDGEGSVVIGGSRIAIVGAGPAGSLLATALLDAGQAAHRTLSVSLYGASTRGRDQRLIFVGVDALPRLDAIGFPVPTGGAALTRLRCHVGRAATEAPTSMLALPRGEVVGGLRAAAMVRGARAVARSVDELRRTADGSWVVRAGGASERADWVVLACGVGAPVVLGVAGHLPPPLWRGCAAELELNPDLATHLAGTLSWIGGAGRRPDLWIVPMGRRARAIAPGRDVEASDLARALLAAASDGSLPGGFELRGMERIFLPAGRSKPKLPTLGSALGGPPIAANLADLASKAQTFAASFVDCGAGSLLARSQDEASRLGRQARAQLARRRAIRRFGIQAAERAIARGSLVAALVREAAAPTSTPLATPTATSSATFTWASTEANIESYTEGNSGAPSVTTIATRARFQRLRAFFVLLWAACASRVAAWLQGRRPAPLPSSRLVYVVDDDPEQAAMIGASLDARSLAFRTFSNGIDAAAAAARERPAAIVLDVALPWLDGAAICRSLKRSSDVPILLTTALPGSLARARWRGSRADAMITKPLDPEALAARLDRCLPAAPGAPSRRRHSG